MTTIHSNPLHAKIAALFAKAERSEYETEAAAYLAKAQQLMIRHAVEDADLAPAEQEQITTRVEELDRSSAESELLWAVVKSCGCRMLLRPGTRFSLPRAVMVGRPSDLACVWALYGSLRLQREAALQREDRPSDVNARSFNHAFRMGYAWRVRARLQKSRQTVEETEPGTALVLAGRDAAVEQRVAAMFPKLSAGRPSQIGSWSGAAAGSRAGGSANVSTGRNAVGGRRAIEAVR